MHLASLTYSRMNAYDAFSAFTWAGDMPTTRTEAQGTQSYVDTFTTRIIPDLMQRRWFW